jgi:multiple sugar transport system substrate-binding protein
MNRQAPWGLGTLLAALLVLAAPAAAQKPADEVAVEAAKKYAGSTLNVIWPAGLGALGQKNYAAPLFKKLTGVTVNILEAPPAQVYVKTVAEHRAGTRAYDVISVQPAWLADETEAGILAPLDKWVDQYGYRQSLREIEPAYRDNWMTVKGKIMAFPDDGDVIILFYRKDLFEDPANKAAFQAKHGYDLAPPTTWEQFAHIGQFFTDKYAPQLHGAAIIHDPASLQYFFQERFRNAGGRFFDPTTMKARINDAAGVKVATQIQAETKFMPPGSENWNPVNVLSAWLAGKVAMMTWWPPPGRWSEGYGTSEEALKWVPESKVKGKVGYALPPGGRPELALGWCLGVSSQSRNQELAYLYIQWVNSEKISLERVQLPYTLRDPFRASHFASPEYAGRWPGARDYLAVLRKGAQVGMLDLSIRNTFQYQDSLGKAMSRLMAGEDPRKVMDDAAADWDRITQRTGVDLQRATYQDWAAKPNAYPR